MRRLIQLFLSPLVAHRAARLRRELSQTIAGIAILKDWLGDEAKTVSLVQAERRAKICSTCPHNTGGRSWDWVKNEVADAVRHQIEVKQSYTLNTSHDDELFTCDMCGCNLQLKVWCPTVYFARKTKPDQLKTYPGHCWQKQEILGD